MQARAPSTDYAQNDNTHVETRGGQRGDTFAGSGGTGLSRFVQKGQEGDKRGQEGDKRGTRGAQEGHKRGSSYQKKLLIESC